LPLSIAHIGFSIGNYTANKVPTHPSTHPYPFYFHAAPNISEACAHSFQLAPPNSATPNPLASAFPSQAFPSRYVRGKTSAFSFTLPPLLHFAKKWRAYDLHKHETAILKNEIRNISATKA
jgi:hypothetical protein